jgi:hypothetical protein
MTLLELYTALKALILANTTNYSNDTVFVGRQNNTVMPTSSNYVIMTKLNEDDKIILQLQEYDTINDLDNSTTLIEGMFQIDFYGSTSEEDAGQFGALLNSGFANSYFNENNYLCSVSDNDPPLDLTEISGRGQYLKRSMVKVKLYYNRVVSVVDNGVITIEGKSYLAEAL